MQGTQFGSAGARSTRGIAWAPSVLFLALLVLFANSQTASAVTCEGGCGAVVADDGRVWFTSFDKLTADATQQTENLYLRAGDNTTLLTPGAEEGLAEVNLSITPIGSRLFVASKADLDPDDPALGDEDPDLFELRGDAWKLWTTGPNDGPVARDWFWRSFISEDGSYVYFESMQRLTPADQDDVLDIYQRHEGQTRLITPQDPSEFESHEIHLVGIAPDGRSAYFRTYEGMTPDDTRRLSYDLFAWHKGDTTLLTGSRGAVTYEDTDFAGTSRDGSRVFFSSRVQLTGGDNDNDQDLYLYRPGKPLGLLDVVAPGSPPCTGRFACGAEPGGVNMSVSLDGSRVVFMTLGRFHPDDNDNDLDVYQWHDGEVTLVSKGQAPGSEVVYFAGMSQDGRRIALSTMERLLPSDTDNAEDPYLWIDGRIVLLSVGTNGEAPAYLKRMSPSGNHVIFGTRASIAGSDLGGFDIYDAVVTEASSRLGEASSRLSKRRTRPRRRPRVRLRLITNESIAPRFSIGATGKLRRDAARVPVGCSRKERSGPCRGKLVLKTRSGRRLGAARFRVKPGRKTTVVVPEGRRPLRAGARVTARVRGSDRFGNRSSAKRTLTLGAG